MWELLRYLRNFFPVLSLAREGDFEIIDGKIEGAGDYIKVGQWFLVEGSVFNDGVYKFGSESLTTETFTGRVTPLRVPKEVEQLATDIAAWKTANAASVQSPYQSESFGGYSYSRATNSNGEAIGWQDAFASELKGWRKL